MRVSFRKKKKKKQCTDFLINNLKIILEFV